MRVTKLDEHRADAITRFEVIDNSGRALVKYDAVVDVHIQDDGRTMKVFLYDRLKNEGKKEENNIQKHSQGDGSAY